MNASLRRISVTVMALIAVITGSCAWIYFVQVRATKFNVGLQRRIGEVLAEQTASVGRSRGLPLCPRWITVQDPFLLAVDRDCPNCYRRVRDLLSE